MRAALYFAIYKKKSCVGNIVHLDECSTQLRTHTYIH